MLQQEEPMLTEDSAPENISNGDDEVVEQIVEELEKNYYCQRCLNHGEHNPRKGHKPDCGYLKCPCIECNMVERRRQLNNLLSKKKVKCAPTSTTRNGKRVRDPHCARCSAHGVLVPLRGHKRTMCQFVTCTCTLCALVENRRMLMAAQIKLRRLQQKTRDGKEPKGNKKEKSQKGPKKHGLVMILDANATNGHAIGAQAIQVTVGEQRKVQGSLSPSPSSTDTMSPSLSMTPPSSPSPTSSSSSSSSSSNLVAPVPIYPLPFQFLQQQHNLFLINCLQQQQQHQLSAMVVPTPSPSQLSTVSPFLLNEQLGAALCSMYLKGCLKI
ncbi:unnamed protein product [Caenorhabditis sp. 36 PRJEB53466]|nr:unnamed protein product [Caenorhabditis sp. 36 PRJEB53466]